MSARYTSATARAVVAVVAGALFGAGVCVAGMVRPSKVIGFLDVGRLFRAAGGWDASLALVMASALALHVVAWAIVRARMRGDRPPPLGDAYPPPASRMIDARLVVGAALFGLGWGLAGFCPGPAVVAAMAGARSTLVFVATMAVTMAAFVRVDRAWRTRAHAAVSPGADA